MLTTPKITGINKHTVHNICSGQVIVTLTTAVKELVENSIDACAKSVQITFRNYGADSIEVSDNGRGISEENFKGLTLKHHTSKIQNFDDIGNVSTFGFRGEALSSLCALGKMSVLTSTGQYGIALTYDNNGEILTTTPQPRAQGTTVTIENLFSTLPVRHKEFHRCLKKEYCKALEVLQAYGMIASNVRLHCVNIVNKRKQVIFSTSGKASLKDNVLDILGYKIFKSLTPVTFTEGQIIVEGFVSKPLPKCGRGSPDRQYYFVNGRPCDYDKISKLVNSVYKLYDKFQYPVVVLSFQINKNAVDCNVTPDKRKMFLDNEALLLLALTENLNKIFTNFVGVFEENTASDISMLYDFKRSEVQSSPTSTSEVSRKTISVPMVSELIHEAVDEDPRPTLLKTETSHNSSPSSNVSRLLKSFENKRISASNSIPIKVCLSKTSIDSQELERGTDQFSITQCPVVDGTLENSILPHSKVDDNLTQYVNVIDVDVFEPRVRKETLMNCSLESIRMMFNASRHLSTSASSSNLDHFRNQIVNTTDAEKELSRTISKSKFKEMKVLGQFNLGFIIIRLENNLFIVDQHATDEKYRFETLQHETKLDNQKLISPKHLSFNGAQEDILISYLSIFEKNGFEFSVDMTKAPGSKVSLVALPRSKNYLFDESDVEELLWLVSEEPTANIVNLRPSKVTSVFASRACRSAVMIGTALGVSEMMKIINHMGDMENPWNCPHGRPTMRHLVDLSRMRVEISSDL